MSEMKRGICPFPNTIRPPYGIGQMAGDLSVLIGRQGDFSSEGVPDIPQNVGEKLATPERQAKFGQDAAFVLIALEFALWLRHPEQEKVLDELNYTPLWKRYNPFAKEQSQEQTVHHAIGVYEGALCKLVRKHMKDPELEHVRAYRKIKQKEAGNKRSLWKSYRGGLATMKTVLQAQNEDYHRLDFSRPEAEVLRESIPVTSFMGSLSMTQVINACPAGKLPRRTNWEYRGLLPGRLWPTWALKGLFALHGGSFEYGEQIDKQEGKKGFKQVLSLNREKIKQAISDRTGREKPNVVVLNDGCSATVIIQGKAGEKYMIDDVRMTATGMMIAQMLGKFEKAAML